MSHPPFVSVCFFLLFSLAYNQCQAQDHKHFQGVWKSEQKEFSYEMFLNVQEQQFAFSNYSEGLHFPKEPIVYPGEVFNYEHLKHRNIVYVQAANTYYDNFLKEIPSPVGPFLFFKILSLNKKKLVLLKAKKAYYKIDTTASINKRIIDSCLVGADTIIYTKIRSKASWTIGAPVVVPAKPIIYLYPTQPLDVEIKVHYKGIFTHTYPKYDRKKGWNVKAFPNGTLMDTLTQKEYYALYWEGQGEHVYQVEDGFVVPGAATIPFLEEKLAQLGLNARESNEFIIYWLPQLEKNPYNFIHFSTQEYAEQTPMEISPKPEQLIRVFMLYQPLEKEITVPKQVLERPKGRKGFTVVEWGGALLHNKHLP